MIMIAYLKGKVLSKDLTHLVLETGGVGYKVYAAGVTLASAKPGQEMEFFIHTHVREDQFSLYGFLSSDELNLFELLISVSGIGPKIALAVLSGAEAGHIRSAIASADAGVFTKVAGVGRKTAERIVVELKEKIGEGAGEFNLQSSKQISDSLDALVALGYNRQEAREAVKRVSGESTDSSAIVRAALKVLGGKE
jgi:holliday junction DNA helicase RuvA